MSLARGRRLGPYEVLGLLGRGGMGEVYQATDTRLGRVVALKTLDPDSPTSQQRRARFEREARMISALNHPHVCALYDIGQQDDTQYLVMEFLDGETLAARLARGPLPIEQALAFAIEILDALDYAHRQGLIHRDLKPANIMLTRRGVKLLDFGISSLLTDRLPRQPPAPGLLDAVLQSTQSGLAGTVHYMAPEQILREDVDSRADLFAFGVTLYEMLSARQAFPGELTEAIDGVLEGGPDPIRSIRPDVPDGLAWVIDRCLAKDAEHRWQSARDVKNILEALHAPDGPLREPPAAKGRRRTRAGLVAAALGALALAGVAAAGAWRSPRDAAGPLVRFEFGVPGNSAAWPRVSPDGRMVVFGSALDSRSVLWLRTLDSPAARPLTQTEAHETPFWSGDSRSIGFFAEHKLRTIAIAGGVPQTICDAPAPRGGTWNRAGVILFSPQAGVGIFRVAAAGGTPVQVTTVDPARGELRHTWPAFLPDGRRFLFVAVSANPVRADLYLASLDSPVRTRLAPVASRAVYDPSGHLIYVRDGTLVAHPFDVGAGRLRGDPIPIADRVKHHVFGDAAFDVSATGVLITRDQEPDPPHRLTWFDRRGQPLGHVGPQGYYRNPKLSPDGRRVVVERLDPATRTSDIWIFDLGRDAAWRFTLDPANDVNPEWSPDGRQIAFSSNRSGDYDVFIKPVTGMVEERLLAAVAGQELVEDWSQDGRWLAFSNALGGNPDVWVLPLDNVAGARRVQASRFVDALAEFSPDTRWLAYTSVETGRPEVYVQSFPGAGSRWQVSTDGGAEPRWSRDGRELFFLAADRALMAVSVKAGASLELGTARRLFDTRVPDVFAAPDFTVTGDGGRFLINTIVEQPFTPPIVATLNWTKLLPTREAAWWSSWRE